MSVFPNCVKHFFGTILETGEKVYGRQEIYEIYACGTIGTISRFMLAKRLQKPFRQLVCTIILDNMKKYEVYINDKRTALVQRNLDTRWMKE